MSRAHTRPTEPQQLPDDTDDLKNYFEEMLPPFFRCRLKAQKFSCMKKTLETFLKVFFLKKKEIAAFSTFPVVR